MGTAPSSLRRVLVTGASRGIGAAVCRELIQHGPRPAQLILCARGAEALEQARAEFEALNRTVAGETTVGFEVVCADVGDPDSLATHLNPVLQRDGGVDALVLNAGIAESAPLHRTSDELFERTMAVNVGGVFRVLRAALPGMLDSGFGRIVAVGSIASKAGYPYISAYCASKHALLGLVRSVAREVVTRGITINAVCPGYVATR